MKARVKATGEIVEVAYHGLGVYVDMNKWDKEYNFDEIIILDNGDQNTCYGHRAPGNWELMEKINELVEEVNRLKRKLGEE